MFFEPVIQLLTHSAAKVLRDGRISEASKSAAGSALVERPGKGKRR